MMYLRLTVALPIYGGATQTIFPEVEMLLLNESDYHHALRFVAARKKTDLYRSVIDFLFCELHPSWRLSCRRFYNDKGPPLIELIDPDELITCTKRLLKALEVAKQLFHEERCKNWTWFRAQVKEAMEVA